MPDDCVCRHSRCVSWAERVRALRHCPSWCAKWKRRHRRRCVASPTYRKIRALFGHWSNTSDQINSLPPNPINSPTSSSPSPALFYGLCLLTKTTTQPFVCLLLHSHCISFSPFFHHRRRRYRLLVKKPNGQMNRKHERTNRLSFFLPRCPVIPNCSLSVLLQPPCVYMKRIFFSAAAAAAYAASSLYLPPFFIISQALLSLTLSQKSTALQLFESIRVCWLFWLFVLRVELCPSFLF